MPFDPHAPQIEVIRSARRTRTASAKLIDDRIQVRIPANLSAAEEHQLIDDVVTKLKRKTTSVQLSDAGLQTRAEQLNQKILEGNAHIGSIRWVTNQNKRWGSCSPATGDIRISHRLKGVPDYVLDAVIVHELVHTFITDGHSATFWAWADRAPKAERAKGFLEAWARMSQPLKDA
jgi:hypothetical protein